MKLQVAPQSMPAGALVTVPAPLPAFDTVSAAVATNVAVTLVASTTSTWHGPEVPEQAPLQPAKRAPDAAVAVSVTVVPSATVVLQAVPQLIPAGALVTVPPPTLSTVRVFGPAGVPTTVSPRPVTATQRDAERQSMSDMPAGVSRIAQSAALPPGTEEENARSPSVPAQNALVGHEMASGNR